MFIDDLPNLTPEQKATLRNWIEKLRSGEYRQLTGHLRSHNNEYCCLGVLCEMYIKDHPDTPYRWEYKWIDGENYYVIRRNGQSFYEDSYESSTLPDYSMLGWVGFTREIAKRLATKNDIGWTFKQIADQLESELNDLEKSTNFTNPTSP